MVDLNHIAVIVEKSPVKVLGTTTLRAISQQLPRCAHQASMLQIIRAGRLAITPGRWCIVLAVPSWLVYVKRARAPRQGIEDNKRRLAATDT